ncbi:MAG: hypothetical protein ACHQYP_07455 [Nitrospiria bacterium]
MKILISGIALSILYWAGASFVESVIFGQGTFLEAFVHPEFGEVALRIWVIALIFLVSTGLFRRE